MKECARDSFAASKPRPCNACTLESWPQSLGRMEWLAVELVIEARHVLLERLGHDDSAVWSMLDDQCKCARRDIQLSFAIAPHKMRLTGGELEAVAPMDFVKALNASSPWNTEIEVSCVSADAIQGHKLAVTNTLIATRIQSP